MLDGLGCRCLALEGNNVRHIGVVVVGVVIMATASTASGDLAGGIRHTAVVAYSQQNLFFN